MARISFLTCFFLVLLRLAIGWHFFFEGLHKIRSHNGADKPFSSQGYFNEAQGPLGPRIREEIGDPDLVMKAKLKLAEGATPAEQMPRAVAADWDTYLEQFSNYYKLNEQQKAEAKTKLDRAKEAFVRWRTAVPSDNDDETVRKKWKMVKRDVPHIGSVELPQNIPAEVARYERVLSNIREVYTTINPEMGRDVAKGQLREMKSEAAKLRDSFQKDIDELTTKMKDSLAKVLDPRSVGFEVGVPLDDPRYDARVLSFLTLEPDQSIPKGIAKQWDDYAAYVKEFGNPALRQGDDAEARTLGDIKQEYVRYLQGIDQYTGAATESDVPLRLKAYRTAVAKLDAARTAWEAKPTPENQKAFDAARTAAESLRKGFMDDIQRFTDVLKHDLGGFSEENMKGIAQVEKPKSKFLGINLPTGNLDYLDTVTPWTLLIAGGCLMAGLFTRMACIVAAGFLLMEYLSQAAFPWLPKSPMTEGNYLFVNKNVIEFVALLGLATTASGRWVGLDGLLSRLWPFRCCGRRKAATQSVATQSASQSQGIKGGPFDAPPRR